MNRKPFTTTHHNACRPPRSLGRIGRLVVWIRRSGHCRGFGVQSPSAYHFIRYVVNEHYPYYAYTRLRRHFPSVQGSDRKLMQFYLRLANHLQPTTVVDLSPLHTEAFRRYIEAGCRRTIFATHIINNKPIALLRIGSPIDQATLEHIMSQTDPRSVVIVEHIGRRRDMQQLWQQLVGDARVSVAYDLYYCGVAFFDTQRFKTSYIVNF